MQSNPFELPLEFPVKPSRRMILVLYVIHAGAMISVLVSGLPIGLQPFPILLVLVSLWHCHRLYIAQDNPASVVAVLLNVRNEWWLKTCMGRDIRADLQAGAFVHPLVIILFFKAEGENFRVVLTPDRINPDDFRRLRVRLRYMKQG